LLLAQLQRSARRPYIKGLAELSLALTLPKQPSADDDRLLTASEVAQLELNADHQRRYRTCTITSR
jgi:hypothetical protein